MRSSFVHVLFLLLLVSFPFSIFAEPVVKEIVPRVSSRFFSSYGGWISWGGYQGIEMVDLESEERMRVPVGAFFVGETALLKDAVVFVGLDSDGDLSCRLKQFGIIPDEQEEWILDNACVGEVAAGSNRFGKWIAWTRKEGEKYRVVLQDYFGGKKNIWKDAEASQSGPRIGDDWLVFLEEGGKETTPHPDVVVYDLRTSRALKVTDDSIAEEAPDVGSWGVVWQGRVLEENTDPARDPRFVWRIFGKRWGEPHFQQISFGPLEAEPAHFSEDHLHPRLWKEHLVYEKQREGVSEVILHNFKTGKVVVIWSKLFELDSRWREGLFHEPTIGPHGIVFLDHIWDGYEPLPPYCYPYSPYSPPYSPRYPTYPYPYPLHPYPSPHPWPWYGGDCEAKVPFHARLLWWPWQNKQQ